MLKPQSHCQESRTRFYYVFKRTKTAKYEQTVFKLFTYDYIRSNTWLVKHSRNLLKPNTYLKRDHILTQRGGEKLVKPRARNLTV